MRKALLHAIALMTALSFCATAPAVLAAEREPPTQLRPGDIPPKSLGITRTRDEIETTQFAGRVMVVTFWASWCGPCRSELTMLEKLQILAKDKLKVVAVNIEEREVFRNVARALAELTVTITNDPGKRYAAAYGVKGIPHMVIIGKDGRIVAVHRGYSDSALDGLLAEINAELAKG
jgi:thiol-disulfide isomerase/thioredoxin